MGIKWREVYEWMALFELASSESSKMKFSQHRDTDKWQSIAQIPAIEKSQMNFEMTSAPLIVITHSENKNWFMQI